MSQCKIFGYIVDGSENPVEGASIQFIPAALPAINTSTGKAVINSPIRVITSSTGYFEVSLIQNTDFIVIIYNIGMKEKIRVPALVEKNLFELVGAYTSGDPTPTDPGSESNW